MVKGNILTKTKTNRYKNNATTKPWNLKETKSTYPGTENIESARKGLRVNKTGET